MIQSTEQDQNLLKLRIKRNERLPSLDAILKARLTENDKLRALELYEVLNKCEIYTAEWFEIERRLKELMTSQFESDLVTEQIQMEETTMLDACPNEHAALKKAIFELEADLSVKTQLYGMYCDMINRAPNDSRYQDLKDKIRLAIKLPHHKVMPTVQTNTPEEIRDYCVQVYNRLEAEIYGMNAAKEQIIQAVNDRIYNPNSYAILALKGAPGLGKTKLAKTIAKAVGRPFEKISLGGVIDSTIFKGSDNVWSGAGPSMLLQILSRVKYADPVILLDEIDKLGTTEKGREVQYALLHILDRTQNKEFQDLFLSEYSHDISKIWFIPAMNDDSTLDPALRDRLHIIKIASYTHQEMIEIIKRHTIPETLADKGILPTELTITDEAIALLIKRSQSEIKNTGMRSLERAIQDLISKLNLLRSMAGTEGIPLTFSLPDFKGFPYTITETTINALCAAPKRDDPFNLIYA
jgi:ATP-dependent Lon protease